ncbi:hypothetical protein WK13_34645 [Burkholderia ubonensis]|uniref:hypothetical protein n=1 Tax=Burkholderia ubonensis TaxID=101571 RepID=UPI00075A4B13|nr:hypothetical protein [Burkholderia ubonensis]KVR21679.1 hypothetical protein WK13_34645 [Burkholderia ubonensis]
MKSTLQKALEALNEEGVVGETRSYSGRGMYGKSCLGVFLDDRAGHANLCQLGGMLVHAADASDQYEVMCDLEGTKTDDLGLGTIVYWPSIEYVGE